MVTSPGSRTRGPYKRPRRAHVDATANQLQQAIALRLKSGARMRYAGGRVLDGVQLLRSLILIIEITESRQLACSHSREVVATLHRCLWLAQRHQLGTTLCCHGCRRVRYEYAKALGAWHVAWMERVASLEQALESRPAFGDLIVVGSDLRLIGPGSGQICVRYRAFGSVEETCVSNGGQWGDSSAHDACRRDVEVGEPLPDYCR
jgi:hypothetical protein